MDDRDLTTRLSELAHLHDLGHVTDEEFRLAKAQLMSLGPTPEPLPDTVIPDTEPDLGHPAGAASGESPVLATGSDPTLSSWALDSRKAMLYAIYGFTAILGVLFIVNLANVHDAFRLVILLAMFGIAFGLEAYYIKRVRAEWDGISRAARFRLGILAILVPPIVGFFAVVSIFLLLAFWLFPFFRQIFGQSPSGRSVGGATPAGSYLSFGTWWGNKEVIYDDHNRPLWVGDQSVSYGADGRPTHVGGQTITYGYDGRPIWIGDREVRYGTGDRLTHVGDDTVS